MIRVSAPTWGAGRREQAVGSTTAESMSNAVQGHTWHSDQVLHLAVLGQENDVFQRKWEVILESFAEKLCIKKSRTSFGSVF